MNRIEEVISGKLLVETLKYNFTYRLGNLYVIDKNTKQRIMKFPLYSGIYRILSKMRLTERLFRLEPRCAVSIDESSILISIKGKILNVNIEKKSLKCEHLFRKEMNSPLEICKYELNGKKNYIYGEYTRNTGNEQVVIYKRNNKIWEQVQAFPKGTIKHIHYIVYDSFRCEFLIATGDSDEESGIWKMDKQFSSIEPIVKGKQIYRACFIFPTKEGFVYATDTPLDDNAIYYYNYNDNTTIKLFDMDGPCIYATRINKGFVMATSVEPDSTLKGWRYKFTNKLGAGVKDRYCHVVYFDGDTFNELLKLEKDIWSMCLFQFGNCQFPELESEYSDFIQLTPVALKKYDGKTLKICLNLNSKK